MRFVLYARKLWFGLWLRCPNCERGQMFTGLFTMRATCPYCQARFERGAGASIGGTMINLCLAEVLSIGGFFISDALFDLSLTFQLTFWVTFNLVFVVLFYRHARAMWVSVLYLSGGVYPDPDHQGEWTRPAK